MSLWILACASAVDNDFVCLLTPTSEPNTSIPRMSSFIPSQVASVTSHPRFSRKRATENLSICGPRGKRLFCHFHNLSPHVSPPSIITYVILCGYSPFRSEDVKVLIKETTDAKIEFHDRYWKNVSSQGVFRPLVTKISLPHPLSHQRKVSFWIFSTPTLQNG